jgi:hypothetical protein
LSLGSVPVTLKRNPAVLRPSPTSVLLKAGIALICASVIGFKLWKLVPGKFKRSTDCVALSEFV